MLEKNIILNKSNKQIKTFAKYHKKVIIRIINDNDFEDFFNKLDLDHKLYRKHREKPLTNAEKINITNYNGIDFNYVNDKWYDFNIYFATIEDIEDFNKNLDNEFNTIDNEDFFVGDKTKSIWYPKRPILKENIDYYDSNIKQHPQFPIYIISKGRYEKRPTQLSLEKMGVDYKIVVEEQEVDLYIKYGVPKEKILIFTKKAQQEIIYTCDKWTDGGGIPVRNFVHKHSKELGFKRHWILDDNIDGFFRFHNNARIPIKNSICFTMIENYVEQFKNIYLCGMNYASMIPEISRRRPISNKNTRIYSCILIQNDLNEKLEKLEGVSNEWRNLWRGTYNEDTDLSLRVLKNGLPTILFNNVLCNKMTTKSCKGGNTDTIYKDNGLQLKLNQLLDFHGDVSQKCNKFKKENHHYVNYTDFKDNKFIFDKEIKTNYNDLIIFKDTKRVFKKVVKKKILTKAKIEEDKIEVIVTLDKVEKIDNLQLCKDFIKLKNLTKEQKKLLIISILE
tara:strand:+ start:521 stop:2035 length:1515 start_codon:yes stop_codon:yes gene_type:complete